MKLLLIFVFIGILIGIAMGIPLGRYICASIVEKMNTTSKGKDVPFGYSTRGLEISKNTDTGIDLPPLSFGKTKIKKVSPAENEYKEALDYFKRNMI